MEGRTGARKRARRSIEASHATEKSATKTAKEGKPAEIVTRRGPRPHLCRQYARRRFAEELPGIVDRFAEDALGGDVAALKALIGLSGFDKEEAYQPRGRRGISVSKLLMRELKKTQAEVKARQLAERTPELSTGHGTELGEDR